MKRIQILLYTSVKKAEEQSKGASVYKPNGKDQLVNECGVIEKQNQYAGLQRRLSQE